MKIIFILFTLLILCDCDGRILNHSANRPGNPVNGKSWSKRFNKDKVKYAQENLQYLKDRKNRNNNIYYASAYFYNRLNYNIANQYIKEYKKYLQVDSKELDNRMKSDQYGVKSEDILHKMENGTMRKYPVKENIDEMQKLKDEDNKIAFPDYMSEYLDIYIEDKKSEDNRQIKQYDNTVSIALNTNTRDEYVDKYLGFYGEYSENKKKIYKEKTL